MATTYALGSLIDAVAARIPGDRLAVVCGAVETTWDEFRDHAYRFAGALAGWGIGQRTAAPEPLDSGHDHVGLMVYNGPAFLECEIGASLAGATAFSVNTRFSATETADLLRAMDAKLLVYSEQLREVAGAAVDLLETPIRTIPVPDESAIRSTPVPHGSYPSVLAEAAPDVCRRVHEPSSEDRILVCTGGTTGTPKGVLWRSEDFFVTSLGGHEIVTDGLTPEDAVVRLLAGDHPRSIVPTPLVHFAAQCVALRALLRGGTVLLVPNANGFDATAFVEMAARYRATDGLMIGEVMVRPVVELLRSTGMGLPDLVYMMVGSTMLSAATKTLLLELIPQIEIQDSAGATEAGMQGVALASIDNLSQLFTLVPGNRVLDDDGEPVRIGEVGVIARVTNLALGYYRNPEATAELWRTGPLGSFTATGDHVRLERDDAYALLGRGSLTINTGGEKVFAQEVEAGLTLLAEVRDALVVGVPSATWGHEVWAFVTFERADRTLTTEQVRDRLSATLARYKLPKRVIELDAIPTLNNGKPDYPAVRKLADELLAGATS